MSTETEAPLFEYEKTGINGERYRSVLYEHERRRSVVVTADSDGVELNYHMHGASYVSLDFSAREARALAAELIAAADAAEQQREAA